jgi:hypothetical protein
LPVTVTTVATPDVLVWISMADVPRGL